ncbi:MAG: GntR family transcriptional regulator [Alphaproteobacteria bacterium]|nr:GntR family transcriptional regulator [Alphaproteobacteria bacterium]
MARKTTDKPLASSAPSRLQAELARRILRLLKDQGSGPGYHLIEQELCQQFGVSRTPIRGALKLLADQGAVQPRANRGFVLVEPVKNVPEADALRLQDEEDKRLFVAIAQARNIGRLPDECTQQEIMRQLGVKLTTIVRVLRQLSELGLVERKPGNGWSFQASINSARAQAESYAFRRVVEPALLLQPGFELDRNWLIATRARHMEFRHKPWRDVEAIEFYEINSDFHEQLARSSKNRYMLNAVQQQIQLRRFLNYQWDYGVERVYESIDEHMAILAALEAGKNEKASALMLSHLTTSAHHSLPFDDDTRAA